MTVKLGRAILLRLRRRDRPRPHLSDRLRGRPASPEPVTEASLFHALADACGKYSGGIVLKVLPCGEVMGNELEIARRERTWPLVKSACAGIRARCRDSQHDIMVDLSTQLHCADVGNVGDLCR